jgi:hypothetical protein
MIRHHIANLRAPKWESTIGWWDLRDRIAEDHRCGDDRWTITQWQRSGGPNPHRTYLFTSEGGAIHAIFFRRGPL